MLEINLALIGIFFSILFSSSEIALISASKLQIDVWIKQNYRLAGLTKYIIVNKAKFLTVSLIGTNLSNILSSSFFTVYFINLTKIYEINFSENLLFIPIALTILIFGEILPKTLIKDYSNIMLLFLSPLLYFFYLLFYPFVNIFNKINITSNKHIVDNKKELLKEKQEEFQHVFEHINDSVNIEKDQKEIISNIFDYRDQTVEKVMTKRVNISAISSDCSLDDLAHKFIDSGHSKLPVFKKNLDNIEGVIYLYDLYSKPEDLVEILRTVLYVPYSKLIPDLMQMFKDTKHSIAIVLDDQGKTAGIITIEDVFEELFGDFEDEFDYEKIQSIKKSDGSIITNAKISIVDFNLKYKNLIPNGTYETIGGYIINKIGRIPKKNEHLFLDIGHVIIRKATSRRIEQIQIFKN